MSESFNAPFGSAPRVAPESPTKDIPEHPLWDIVLYGGVCYTKQEWFKKVNYPQKWSGNFGKWVIKNDS